MKRIFSAVIALALFATACNSSSTKEKTAEENTLETAAQEQQYIVSLNGTLTEVLYALGKGDQIVGTDVTSVYPKETSELPKLGHVNHIQAEGIISLQPDVVYALENELSPELQEQLKSTGIELQLYPLDYSLEGAKNLINALGKSANAEEKASELIAKIDEDAAQLKTLENQPKALFIYARGVGNLLVAGENTQMDAMIKMAGAKNAAEGFEGFKPLTPEALVAANPDAIIMFDSGKHSVQSEEGTLSIPGIEETTAGKNNNIITMEGLYLAGFGPRVGSAMVELNNALANL